MIIANYDEAVDFAQNRRDRLPPLYYRRRVSEKPLPNLAPLRPIEAENSASPLEENNQLPTAAAGNSLEPYKEQNAPTIQVEKNVLMPIEEVFVENAQLVDAIFNEPIPAGQEPLVPVMALVHLADSNEEAAALATGNPEDPIEDVKYEIMLDQNDHDEIENFLDEVTADETEAAGASNESARAVCHEATSPNGSAIAASNQAMVSTVGSSDSSDDEIEFVDEGERATTKLPLPKTFKLNGFVKRENNRFSADLPFGQTVSVHCAMYLHTCT